jgi:hypothetical protein
MVYSVHQQLLWTPLFLSTAGEKRFSSNEQQ